ncbi:MAG: hypothetical protein LC751_01165 [Actinobacteria bacterium]|nr:hypothetical protein [Actinomycetota bacterium]MCA1739765.1 hypothetical protein [Actinomycetota bacterium]
MHGIVRVQNFKQNSSETSKADIARVIFRYSDGRILTFVPEAGREDYSEDDMRELVKVLERVSSTAEWAEAGSTAGAGG